MQHGVHVFEEGTCADVVIETARRRVQAGSDASTSYVSGEECKHGVMPPPAMCKEKSTSWE